MPQQPNKLLRLAVPFLISALGVGVVAAVFINSNRQKSGTPPAQTAPAPSPAPTSPTPVVPTGPVAPTGPTGSTGQTGPTGQALTAPASPAEAPKSAPGLEGLHAVIVPESAFASIGGIDPLGPATMQVEFSNNGAGIKSLQLSKHFDTVRRETHTLMQSEQSYTLPASNANPSPQENVITPMAAIGIEIEGTTVPLTFALDSSSAARPVWKQTSPGTFEASVANAAGQEVARIRRTYTIAEGSYYLRVNQSVSNLTAQPLKIRWIQFGPNELVQDSAGYGGDRRRLRFGYILKPEVQKGDPLVSTGEFQWWRSSGNVIGAIDKTTGQYPELKTVWPNTQSTREQFRPIWVGLTNRYFGVALTPLPAPNAGPDTKVFGAASTIDRVLLQRYATDGKYDPTIILRTTSDPVSIAAGGAADLSMGLYAGPLERRKIKDDPLASSLSLDELVVYNFGGPCGFCTFSFMTSLLLSLLHFLHDNILFDWALSIMVFVLFVRTLLHPVTKWSQIRLQRFGRQMQSMAPKQKKIQEKYGNDKEKLREEMAKLWREEGVNPMGALGCIPMFLQMPIWYAMSAMLYFAFELRHQGAFFGAFQSIIPGFPKFLGYFMADLAEPDRFVYFGKTLFNAPLLGPISSINILPIILGIVFFIQQKYLTPPTQGQLTPEQEQQQRMMKWMMVFMFPLMMYNAPSGLALYFITNSTLGILESRYIRKHIDKYDLLKQPDKKSGGKPGFMARMQQLAQERQQQMLKAKGQYPPRRKG